MKSILVYLFIPEMVLFLVLIRVRVVYTGYVKKIDRFSSQGCGNYRPSAWRVLGGDETESGEFPWITSIQSLEGKHFCAGFLVSSRFLITAAHCFSKRYNPYVTYEAEGTVVPESVKVAIGRVQLSDNLDPSKLIGVRNLILHPEFQAKGLNNDIAILELQNDMEWNEGVKPICLPKVQNEDPGTGNVTVAGWGYRQCESFTSSNELHKITVPLWNAETCKQVYEDANYDFARRDYVCAGSDGKDISKGDSGGPLMFLSSENRWTAVGIASSGRFMCSDRVPGVYTKVSSYLDWIENKIK